MGRTAASRMGRAERHAALVGHLSGVIAGLTSDLDALVARRRALHAREYAARALLAQAEALLELSRAVRAAAAGGCGGGGAPGPGASSGDSSASGVALAGVGASACDEGGSQCELEALIQQVKEESPPEPDTDGATSSAAGAPADGGARPPLGWCPARAAALLPVAAGQLTTEGLRCKLRNLVAAAGCLLP